MGNYTKINWETGDKIHASEMNQMDDGIEYANNELIQHGSGDPTNDAEDGDIYINDDDDSVWIYKTDSWHNIGTLHGLDLGNHNARHENGGADEISVTGLSGDLADPQDPKTHNNDAHNPNYTSESDFDDHTTDDSAHHTRPIQSGEIYILSSNDQWEELVISGSSTSEKIISLRQVTRYLPSEASEFVLRVQGQYKSESSSHTSYIRVRDTIDDDTVFSENTTSTSYQDFDTGWISLSGSVNAFEVQGGNSASASDAYYRRITIVIGIQY